MAQVIEIKTAYGSEWMLRGKLGDHVYQIRNGKQIMMNLPQKRISPPSAKELLQRQRFGSAQAQYKCLTPDEVAHYRQAWQSSRNKYKGKRYSTSRGYTLAILMDQYSPEN